jgi:hypothetical protein
MGVTLRPDLAEVYHEVALAYGLPALLPGNLDELSVPPSFVGAVERIIAASPIPSMKVLNGYGVPPEDRRAFYLDALPRLGPGLHQLVHHAALPGGALSDAEGRAADHASLVDPEVRRVMAEFVPLTWYALRAALRAW